MATDPLKLVQIGTGGIGNYHLRIYKDLPEIQVVGVFDVAAEAAHRAAEKHEIATVYPTLEAALADDTAEAVMVAVPNQFHTEITCQALAAGKHVICEKPLAPTAAGVEEMIAARDRSGKLLMTGQHMRFENRTRRLKQLIDAGRLGEVYYAKAAWLRRNGVPPTPGFLSKRMAVRGPGADLGVHVVDLAVHLMGPPAAVAVSGMATDRLALQPGRYNAWGEFDPADFEVEDFACGWVRFANGSVLTVEVSWMLNLLESETYGVELFGERGGCKWPDLRWVGDDNGVINVAQIESVRQPPGDGHKNEFQAFAEAVRSGGPSPVPAEESLTVARILDGLYRSAETGREVRFDGE